jgi:hypothetical protein
MNPNVAPEQSNLEVLKPVLLNVIRQKVDEEAEFEKQRQNLRLSKADNYNKGNPWLSLRPDGMGGLAWSDSTGVNLRASERDLEAQGIYDYHIDITKSYGRKYVAVLGTRPFHNLKAQPEDPQSETDRKAARQAELAWIWLRNKWNVRIRNIEVFDKQWRTGNVFGYLSYVADPKMFGTFEEPQYEEVPVTVGEGGYVCPNCGTKSPRLAQQQGVDEFGQPLMQSACPACGAPMAEYHYQQPEVVQAPQLTGYVTYPNAGPRLTLTTGYTVTIPQDATDLDTAAWLLYEYEAERGTLLQVYGDALRRICDDKGEIRANTTSGLHEQGERYRSAAASIGSQYRAKTPNRWTFSRYWFTTAMYEHVTDKSQREQLYEQYPDGLKITMVEGNIIALDNEDKSERWDIFQPEPGDYVYRDPMCWGVLPMQDIVNDFGNLMIAHLERGLPALIADPDIIDRDLFGEGRNLATEILFASKPLNGRQAFEKIPTADFPNEAFPLMQMAEGNVQNSTGIRPEVFGAGEKSATAEEARNKLNQALMQLSVPGEYTGNGWKNIAMKAVGLIAKFGTRGIPVGTGAQTSEVIDLEALKSGRYYFESDPGIPMSWTERRDQLNHIIGQNPQMAAALGIDLPDNIPVVRDFLLSGMAELRVPDEDLRDFVNERIRELLEGPPIDNGQGLLPSIPTEDYLPFPKVAEFVFRWLIGPQGRRAKLENPQGFQNVVAFAMDCQMRAQPPMPPEGAPGALPPPDQPQSQPPVQ